MLAWPFLAIGTSVSFYIFLYIAYRVYNQYGYVFKIRTWYDGLFIVFPIIGLLSLVLAPPLQRAPGALADAQIWLQYVYWMVLVLFIKTHGSRFDWEAILRTIFWAVNILIFCFYLIPFKISFLVLDISFSVPRNAFIFQLLCLVPACLFYLRYRYSLTVFWFFVLVYLLTVLYSEGRAGSIIIFIEVFIVVYLFSGSWRSILRVALIPVIMLSAYFYTNYSPSQDTVDSVAGFVDNYNPRLASLVKGEGEGDLTRDKSWLLRELMIEKSKAIVKDWPLFGIGLHHFARYDFSFSEQLAGNSQFVRLSYQSDDFYNTRSAHNSYFQILAETGYAGLIVILLIVFVPVIRLLIRLVKKPTVSLIFCAGLVGISIHYYVISSITGAIGWFTLGLTYFFLEHGHWISLPHSDRKSGRR